MTKCHGCSTPLPLDGVNPCAILICTECRLMSECRKRPCTRHNDRQHDALRLAREAMSRHLAEHKIEYQRTKPYWPFRDGFEAAAFMEAA